MKALQRRLAHLEAQECAGPTVVWFPGEPRPANWPEAERNGIAVSFPDCGEPE